MSNIVAGYPAYPTEKIVEERTSVMSIMSLIFSLLCCLPGPSLIGAVLGGFALFSIGRSEGRLVGRGMAIAGIIIGLIVTALWAGATIGAGRVWGVYIQTVTPIVEKMVEADKGDDTALRSILVDKVSASLTPEDFNRFRDGYQKEMGHILSTPESFMTVMTSMSENKMALEQLGQTNDAFPIIATFEKGTALIVVQMDRNTTRGQTKKFINIQIITPTGVKWLLYDPQKISGQPPSKSSAPLPAPTPTPTPDATPTDKDAPSTTPPAPTGG